MFTGNVPRNTDVSRSNSSAAPRGVRSYLPAGSEIGPKIERPNGQGRRAGTIGSQRFSGPPVSDRPPEPVAGPAAEPGLSLSEEIQAFLADSLKAFAEFLAEKFAAVHGVGLLFRVAKWAYGASEWVRTAEGDGGVDIELPLPLGPDFVLEVSAHLGGDEDAPPVTFFVAPAGESGVGAVSLGKLEFDPATGHADAGRDRLQVSQETRGSAWVVPMRLAERLPRDLGAAEAVAEARKLAEKQLLPGLRQRRQDLRRAGVDLVIGCDAAMGMAVWVDLSDADRSLSPAIRRDGDSQTTGVGPATASLVIRPDPVAGLAIWLWPSHAARRSSPVLIKDAAANTAGTAVQVPAVTLTRLVLVSITSWLAQSGPQLSKMLGIDIELNSRADKIGKNSAHIRGPETANGGPVIIVAQRGATDHEHLGEIIAYAGAAKPATIVWVAGEFRDEHRAALDWLNAQTSAAVRFFGVRLSAATLAAAPAGLIAPRLELVVSP
jgi:hypothetical protein